MLSEELNSALAVWSATDVILFLPCADPPARVSETFARRLQAARRAEMKAIVWLSAEDLARAVERAPGAFLLYERVRALLAGAEDFIPKITAQALAEPPP